MKSHCCPVCYGRGKLPCDFYSMVKILPTQSTAMPLEETCRTCGGKGIVWELYQGGTSSRLEQREKVAEVKIVTCCPSCSSQTLFIGAGGHLTCSLLGCKEPSVERAIKQHKADLKIERLQREDASVLGDERIRKLEAEAEELRRDRDMWIRDDLKQNSALGYVIAERDILKSRLERMEKVAWTILKELERQDYYPDHPMLVRFRKDIAEALQAEGPYEGRCKYIADRCRKLYTTIALLLGDASQSPAR